MAKSGQILSVEVDVSKAKQALSGTSKSLVSISRQSLGIIARGTVTVLKKEIRATTDKITGELLKAYRYKVSKDGSHANVFPKALNGERTIFPKVMALSYGRKKDALKPRGFVQKGEEYVEKGRYEDELQKMIDRELDKYWS